MQVRSFFLSFLSFCFVFSLLLSWEVWGREGGVPLFGRAVWGLFECFVPVPRFSWCPSAGDVSEVRDEGMERRAERVNAWPLSLCLLRIPTPSSRETFN